MTILGGADIRATCQPGQPDRYRFLYNGNYVEQVRSYDILATNQPDYYRLKVAVAEEADLREIITELGLPDIFRPWRLKVGSRILGADVVRNIKTVLAGNGFFSSKPPKRGISSIEFYWSVSACLEGKFIFNTYVWPSGRFRKLAFPSILNAWDKTEIHVNPHHNVSEFDVYGTYQQHEFGNYFHIHFDNQGVVR
ncbi:MAG: hypothetical protein VYE18_00205 [Pseudomonadota bacterium]|nr:hypothetical protein [Pseudomonadota bacterium]